MWKSFFLATGIILRVERSLPSRAKVVLKPKAQPIKAANLLPGSGQRPRSRSASGHYSPRLGTLESNGPWHRRLPLLLFHDSTPNGG